MIGSARAAYHSHNILARLLIDRAPGCQDLAGHIEGECRAASRHTCYQDDHNALSDLNSEVCRRLEPDASFKWLQRRLGLIRPLVRCHLCCRYRRRKARGRWAARREAGRLRSVELPTKINNRSGLSAARPPVRRLLAKLTEVVPYVTARCAPLAILCGEPRQTMRAYVAVAGMALGLVGMWAALVPFVA
jgi:hypothetical protein